ncbi:cupin domain-containing protein [Nostoc sp. PA-18-2419]|uniref:cupin domain-containing protein n=1 Tax=Nostoc sp. PA-18-2419 TaxID=2575443 RepID=UPI001108E0E4|nr:cupin domain-containing protein [Nostoc sp. PA-18-2419]
MQSLKDLIKPYQINTFLEKNWTKEAIFLPSDGERNFNNLFSWDKLTDLINYHEFEFPSLRLSKNGKILDKNENTNFLKHCQEGATLVIDRIHNLVPEIATFTSKLRHSLGCRVHVNLYCSLPKQQGFSCHYDPHEVFILQIDGQKEWQIFNDTFKYPLPAQKSDLFSPPDGQPYLNCVLKPGDILYIPRGHWHYAVALDQPSLHLTVGVHCKTGIDFLEWLISELSHKEEWRKSMPLITDGISASEHLDNLIQNLVKDITNNDDIPAEYIDFIKSSEKPIVSFSLPYQLGFNIFPNGRDTKFTRPNVQRVRISDLSNDNSYKIKIWNKEIILRGVTTTLVNNLFSKESFNGNDVVSWLPDFDWEIDIVPLLSRLVLEGIIFVNTSTDA